MIAAANLADLGGENASYIEVPNTLAPTIANALDKVADELSDRGYTDGEWDTTRAGTNERRGGDTVLFRIDPVPGSILVMAECGSCTLCCKLLGIDELKKPPGSWCGHCTPGTGCQIYPDRPKSCREFECEWLANDGSPDLRPDRIHMVVTGEAKKLDAYVVHVDPSYRGAADRPLVQKMLRHLTTNGRYKNVVLVTGSKRRFIGNDPAKIQRLMDAMDKEAK